MRLDPPLRQQLDRRNAAAVIVIGVEPESPAAAANVEFGDLMLSVGARPIESAIDLKIALTRIHLGSPVGVQVYRAGAKLDTTIVVRERKRQ